jgi:hypothetical protein
MEERDRLFSMGTASGAVSTLSPSAAARRAARTRRRAGAGAGAGAAATDAESARRGRARACAAGSAGAARHMAADLGTAAASIGAARWRTARGAGGSESGRRLAIGTRMAIGKGNGEEQEVLWGLLLCELRLRLFWSLFVSLWDLRLLGFCQFILSLAMPFL